MTSAENSEGHLLYALWRNLYFSVWDAALSNGETAQ